MLKKHLKNKFLAIAVCFGILIFSGFFVTYVLAADDNVNAPVCQYIGCDTSQAVCTSSSDKPAFDWTSYGYPGGAGNPNCCGDDSSELYKICKKHSNISWSCNDVKSCCSQALNNCISPDGSCVQGD